MFLPFSLILLLVSIFFATKPVLRRVATTREEELCLRAWNPLETVTFSNGVPPTMRQAWLPSLALKGSVFQLYNLH